MTALCETMRRSRGHDLLRFLTCGSVDDGKSTLIGRLLHDCALIYDDQLETLERESRRFGTTGGDIDFSLLLDGLEDERQQRITIDVAYRFFATAARSFVVADTPGHEQYTRNMATGASTCDLAVLLVDARNGIVAQTRQHAFVCSLLGIRHLVLAVNKMDLIGFAESRFVEIAANFSQFASSLDAPEASAIPLSALMGDNVTRRSDRMPWYQGPTLLEHLETIQITRGGDKQPLRFPVQWVNRPNGEFRGFSGTVVSGSIAPGDLVLVAGSGRSTRVREIVTFDGLIERAEAGAAVTLRLADEIDIARGDLLADPRDPPEFVDQFAAHVIWMSEHRMVPGRSYLLKIGTRTVPATITALKHRVDVGTLAHLADKSLALNDIGFCNLSTAAPVAFDPYIQNRDTGGFILIDRLTNETAGAGMIAFGLRRASNIHWQSLTVGHEERAALKGQAPAVLWLTGLSGAGKSTIADLVEKQLLAAGRHTMLLDGDNVRHGLNRDLGFTDVDRVENIRRVGEVAKLMAEAGLIVICSFISPFRAERQMVRALIEPTAFFEIFIDAPIDECIRRDPKGLYAKARAGQIPNFTGVDSPYEAPEAPELRLGTLEIPPEDAAAQIIETLRRRRII
ncbi:MAG: sulfate adenylyltransferase subunit CysN [Alphaproteobacteria bacterium]|nr:sulfate adenylyltransferase subunit CysN [Alphaproteobacteria bacterium]